MHRLLFAGTLVLFLMSFIYESHQAPQYFIQCKIHTVSTPDEAKEVDEKMIKRSGIGSSNTDYITSTYFCLLEPGNDYAEDDFKGWFSKFGYSISCFYRGTHGVDAVLSPHELKNCKDLEEGN